MFGRNAAKTPARHERRLAPRARRNTVPARSGNGPRACETERSLPGSKNVSANEQIRPFRLIILAEIQPGMATHVTAVLAKLLGAAAKSKSSREIRGLRPAPRRC